MTYTVKMKKGRRVLNFRLSTLQRISLALTGRAYVGHEQRLGWSGSLPFYAFECPTHGLVKNYPMGYDKRLECPKCLEEAI